MATAPYFPTVCFWARLAFRIWLDVFKVVSVGCYGVVGLLGFLVFCFVDDLGVVFVHLVLWLVSLLPAGLRFAVIAFLCGLCVLWWVCRLRALRLGLFVGVGCWACWLFVSVLGSFASWVFIDGLWCG